MEVEKGIISSEDIIENNNNDDIAMNNSDADMSMLGEEKDGEGNLLVGKRNEDENLLFEASHNLIENNIGGELSSLKNGSVFDINRFGDGNKFTFQSYNNFTNFLSKLNKINNPISTLSFQGLADSNKNLGKTKKEEKLFDFNEKVKVIIYFSHKFFCRFIKKRFSISKEMKRKK